MAPPPAPSNRSLTVQIDAARTWPKLAAIAGLTSVKEAGVPIPVPGDLVVIGAGVAAGRGEIEPAIALVAIVLASILGGVGQIILLRSVARPAMLQTAAGDELAAATGSSVRLTGCGAVASGPSRSRGPLPAFGS